MVLAVFQAVYTVFGFFSFSPEAKLREMTLNPDVHGSPQRSSPS